MIKLNTAMRLLLIPPRLVVAIVCLLPALSVAQHAQPTDTQLRAGYCLAVVQNRLAAMQEISRADVSAFPEPHRTQIKQTGERMVKEEAERLTRLRAYVLPMLNSLEPTALLAAHNRGQRDDSTLREQRGACSPTCGKEDDSDKYLACWSACGDPQLVRRIAQCENLNWLPF